ncbi:MAG: translocation/assembly module TamB domain-containing protein [Bacteroidota bacterium]
MKYLSNSIGTEIKADKIDISFFDKVQLNDAVVFDSEGDTLVYLERIKADISFFSFFNKKLTIDELTIKGARGKLLENSQGVYNFQHIIDHLSKGEEVKESSTTWEILLDAINLENTEIGMSAKHSHLLLKIHNLQGSFKEFSIEDLLFHFDKLEAEGLNLSYNQTNSTPQNESDNSVALPALPFTLLVDQISVNGERITYHTQDPTLHDDHFDPNHFDLRKLSMYGSNFIWSDSIQMNLEQFTVQTMDGIHIADLSSDIFLSDTFANLNGTTIKTPDSELTFDAQFTYKDFNSLVNDFLNESTLIHLEKATIAKSDIKYYLDKNSIPGVDINNLNDLELQGKFELASNRMSASKIILSNGTDLSFVGDLTVSDLANFERSIIDFNLNSIRANQAYVEQLIPSFNFPVEFNDLGTVTGQMNGRYTKNEITFESLDIASNIGLKIAGSGSVGPFESADGLLFDFTVDNLEANPNTLFSEYLELPSQVKSLGNINYTGILKGDLKNILADGTFLTSIGKAELDAQFNFNEDYSDARYEGFIRTEEFNLGMMLNDTTYGIVNFEGKISGQGLSVDGVNANMNGKVHSIYYDGKTYEDITINGDYKDKIFEGSIVSNDEKLNLNIDGKLDLSGEKPNLDVTMNMQHFDLKKIGLSDSLMILGGIFRGRVSGSTIDDIFGDGTIENFSIRTEKGIYTADSLIHLTAKESREHIKAYSIESPFFDGKIQGRIEPSTLIRYVKNYIKAYIPLEIGYDENIEDNLVRYFEENEDQNFIFSAKAKDINPFLVPFLGNDVSIGSANLGAYFSSEETQLDIKGHIDSLLYNGILLQSGTFFFDGRKSFINGNINLENIISDNEVLVPLTTINTALNNKVADFNMIMANNEEQERLNISGDLTRTDEYIITFNDSVYLNGFNWNFSPYNQVIFGDYGFYIQDVRMTKDNQSITLYTDENENGEAIEVLFDNFILSELTAIIAKENEFVEGEIDGSLIINSLYSNPFITADLGLRNVTIADHEAGNLTLIAAQDLTTNSIKSVLRLSGPQNDATLNLNYGISSQSTKGELDIGRLEMAIIDPYLTDVFIDSEGYINGKVDIDGDLNNLDLKGKIYTHNVKTTPVFTNSRYKVLDTEISFSDTKIDFGTVELRDKNGNSAFVSGKILHKNLRNSIVDLQVKTENFEFLNTTENENELFFGNVNISGNALIAGPIDDLEIDGSAKAINASNLTVSPLSLEEDLLSDDFIIYSGDPRKIPVDSLRLKKGKSKQVIPFDVEVKVIVEEDAEFSMILDPITGDKITCNGNANLTLKLSKSGELELFGTYTVTKGVYSFSYGILSKKFILQPGSTVTFNGNPLQGVLNVDATYIANTSVYDLIQLEGNLSDAEKSEALRKKDIKVLLNLTERIEKPKIKLDITVDEEDFSPAITDILQRKLLQLREEPDELNNQVFGLLLFNNFILAKNAETDLAQTGTDFAISSISNLVAQQLNRLADGLIEGFEVNFNVNAYSSDLLSTGQEGVVTELGLDVKKSLFNDRITLTVGTNLNLESSSEDSDFNSIIGDFVLGYKIDEDGNYRAQVYSKSTFDRLTAEGNSAKNGVGLFIRKEFGEIKRKKKDD